MPRYLLDTNILLRASDPASLSYPLAVGAVSQLLSENSECFITAQVLIEFWVVATRPVEVNGLGWSAEQTRNEIEQLLEQFPLLEETPQVFRNWLQLVSNYRILGKRTHDVRLLAVMQAHGINHLLTFNPDDFPRLADITIVHPQELISP
ncbi:MAG: PIN domain-containing protein [Oscillatoria princeps RMCB-10]|jgi:predicted nucleic acid-binding protein|nr:PIN domain-containing protein [Oscillatoria princeps RMCB-10]